MPQSDVFPDELQEFPLINSFNFTTHYKKQQNDLELLKYKIVDNETNLMWQKHRVPEKYVHYKEATKWIISSNILQFAGFSDWRLPNLKEALSLVMENKRYFAGFLCKRFRSQSGWVHCRPCP